MSECAYCRTVCNDGETPCIGRAEAEKCEWFTDSDRRAISVSDGRREAGETVGLDPKDDSAVGIHAETPNPSSPVLSEAAVEEMRKRLVMLKIQFDAMAHNYRGGHRVDHLDIEEFENVVKTSTEAASLLKAQQDALEEMRKERSSYSCNGVTVYGDRKSIDAVAEAFHAKASEPQLRERLVAIQSQLAEKDREIERLKDDFEQQGKFLELANWTNAKATTKREEAEASLSTLQKRLEEVEGALKGDLLQQARRVRNYSDPDDVFEAVPVRFIKSMDEARASFTPKGESK